MFKKLSSSFFSENSDGKKEDHLSESVSSWRKTVSPVPSFLLRPQQKTTKGKKEESVKIEESTLPKKQGSKKLPLEKKTELPRFYLSDQEKKTFGRASLYDLQNIQERYVFTMTKFSFWTVLGSLLVLGVLFFFCGFGVALYLMTSSPAFLEKIEHKIAWKGDSLESLEKKFDHKDKSTSTSEASSPSASLVSVRAVPLDNSPSPALPLPPGGASSTAAEPVSPSEGHKSMPDSPSLVLPSRSPLKESPLLAHSSQNSEKSLAPYSLEYGNFTTRGEALKRADSLTQKGYRPIIVRLKGALRIFSFSVRCGNYPTRESAVKDLQNADKEFEPTVVRNSSESAVVYP
ncbi:MAG: hypothetical protein B7Y25_04350 [Alphaproteobacteria bacterium 16-39-46]|nr:MAG: hypothetical protein B7Y25_04350 [Alphaproteobacteria bacterium 16-39-46]OZA43052.1 MAG: hypothetical protein B7X84_04270 [Alphaproteobacteria bacterium 17-39-52]HQS84123.1 SPOR domain-containing protein [Alphaproteobacteria bacterium]HQS93837.1 SPOR domain-containing protein [Alphaproteobacteria bacterium]